MNELTLFRVVDADIEVVPATPGRAWIRQHAQRLPAACLPLLVANQLGWFILTAFDVRVRWNGKEGVEALRIDTRAPNVVSGFGGGIITWQIPYLFRTPPGWGVWVKGPANLPFEGAVPLEGVVETDQANETFTMSWKLTSKGEVVWPSGFPICQVVPVPLAHLTDWTYVIEHPPSDVQEAFDRWTAERTRQNSAPPYRPLLGYQRRARFRRTRTARRGGDAAPVTDTAGRQTDGHRDER